MIMWLWNKVLSISTPYLIMGIMIAVMSTVGYFYFNYTQNKIDKLISNSVVLTMANDAKTLVVSSLKKNIVNIQETFNNLIDKKEKDLVVSRKLDETLTKLDKTAKAKPKLVENLINNAAKDRNRCLALSTGAKALKNEKNAVCPQLLK